MSLCVLCHNALLSLEISTDKLFSSNCLLRSASAAENSSTSFSFFGLSGIMHFRSFFSCLIAPIWLFVEFTSLNSTYQKSVNSQIENLSEGSTSPGDVLFSEALQNQTKIIFTLLKCF